MTAVLAALCNMVGALTVFQQSQGGPIPKIEAPGECFMLVRKKEFPIEGILLGPAKDLAGDSVWLVHVAPGVFSVTWQEPKAKGAGA